MFRGSHQGGHDFIPSDLGSQVAPGSRPGSPGAGSTAQSGTGSCPVGTDLTPLALPPRILSCLHRARGHLHLGPRVTVDQGFLPPGPQVLREQGCGLGVPLTGLARRGPLRVEVEGWRTRHGSSCAWPSSGGPAPGCWGPLRASPSPVMGSDGSSSLQRLLSQPRKTSVTQRQPHPRLARAV